MIAEPATKRTDSRRDDAPGLLEWQEQRQTHLPQQQQPHLRKTASVPLLLHDGPPFMGRDSSRFTILESPPPPPVPTLRSPASSNSGRAGRPALSPAALRSAFAAATRG